MVFSSPLFIFYFLPAVLALYYAAPRRAKHLLLTLFSYVFYGWANPLFTVLLVTSTAIDYIAALIMVRGGTGPEGLRLNPDGPRRRAQRAALVLTLCSNLGLL